MTTSLMQQWREEAEKAGWTEGEEEAFKAIEGAQKTTAAGTENQFTSGVAVAVAKTVLPIIRYNGH